MDARWFMHERYPRFDGVMQICVYKQMLWGYCTALRWLLKCGGGQDMLYSSVLCADIFYSSWEDAGVWGQSAGEAGIASEDAGQAGNASEHASLFRFEMNDWRWDSRVEEATRLHYEAIQEWVERYGWTWDLEGAQLVYTELMNYHQDHSEHFRHECYCHLPWPPLKWIKYTSDGTPTEHRPAFYDAMSTPLLSVLSHSHQQQSKVSASDRADRLPHSKVSASDRADRLPHCGSTWPLRGWWLKQGDVNTWTFDPSVCEQHPEQPPNPSSSSSSSTTTTNRVYAALKTCLANRRVIILGNSIGRQFAFELPVLLDLQERADRAQQKEQCLKSTGARCVLNVGQNTSVWSAWFLYWDNLHANVSHPPQAQPGGWFKEGWEMDVCGISSTIDCITGIIGSSEESDVLILVIGISYALWDPVDVAPWDLQSWRQHQITKFADVLKTIHFKGTVVVITTTPIQSFPDVPFFRDSSSTDHRRGNRYLQERIERYNEHVIPFILQNTKWYIFDAFSMNYPVLYSNLYSDESHFPGRLTALSWRVLIPIMGCN